MLSSLCPYVHCKSVYVSSFKYTFCFSALMFTHFCASESVYLFAYLAATLLLSLYLVNVFTVVVSLICNTIFIFINHHPSCFFHIFNHPLGENWIYGARAAGSSPNVLCMSKPFKINTHYFVLFVLQSVTFCFCLF